MIFNINEYSGKYVMHCKTEKEARNFCDYLHNMGRKWSSSTAYFNNTFWYVYEDKTVYYFNEGLYGDLNFVGEKNYKILEWSDFMTMDKEFTKVDLKTGDIVLYRNGETGIVNCSFDMIINKDGYNNFDDYKNNLIVSYLNASNWDIMAVRRPRTSSSCQFSAFKNKWGDLIYERKEVEVEEMTLEEVCKALGKEIKIIKG